MNPPITDTVELEAGGTVTLTRFDGEPVVRCAFERDGVRFSFGLAPVDVVRLNEATVVMAVAAKVRP